jgi:predicted dithiol-disulfide oxidoreductase (DUF899 family)
MTHHTGTRAEWLEARLALLAEEKDLTHRSDAVARRRQELPWVRIDKDYRFDTPHGSALLKELFKGRSQLMVYHFMFGPDWEAGCPGCSFLADHLDGTLPHLNHHDVTLISASRAPLDKIVAYKRRMGWRFPWVSAFGSDFNRDFGASFSPEDLAGETVNYGYVDIPAAQANDELPGLSAFYRDEAGQVFHTYSTYARGAEDLLGTMMILDRAPLGRNEEHDMDFIRRHDEYGDAPKAACCGAAAS